MLLSHFLYNKRRPNLDTKEIFFVFLSVTCKIWCSQTWHLHSLKIHSSTFYIWVPAVEQPRNSFLLYQPYCAVRNPLSLLRSALEGSTAAGRTAGHKPGQRVDSWTNLEVKKPLLTMAAELDVSQVIGDPRIPIHDGKRVQKQWDKQMEIKRGKKKKKITILVLKDVWEGR